MNVGVAASAFVERKIPPSFAALSPNVLDEQRVRIPVDERHVADLAVAGRRRVEATRRLTTASFWKATRSRPPSRSSSGRRQ